MLGKQPKKHVQSHVVHQNTSASPGDSLLGTYANVSNYLIQYFTIYIHLEYCTPQPRPRQRERGRGAMPRGGTFGERKE